MSKGEDAAFTTRSIKANASALGLTWNLRLATVKTGGQLATVLLDGDDAATPAISAISLIGVVTKGARVMTLWIPPNTLYVIGSPGGTVARNLTNRVYQQATSDLTLNTTPTLIPGTLVTVTTLGAAEWEVNAVFDFAQTVAGAPSSLGALFVDGVTMSALVVRTPAASAVSRQASAGLWAGTFAAGSTHTFELRASVSAVSGTSLARITHTTILAKTYE